MIGFLPRSVFIPSLGLVVAEIQKKNKRSFQQSTCFKISSKNFLSIKIKHNKNKLKQIDKNKKICLKNLLEFSFNESNFENLCV